MNGSNSGESSTDDDRSSNEHSRRPDDDDDDDKLHDHLQKIPKVELHAHLNGCIREETLFELAEQRNVKLSEHHFRRPPPPCSNNNPTNANDDGLHLLYNVMPRSLQDCFDMFAEIPLAVNDLPALRRIAREALEDFAHRDHCVYLELRSTPKRLMLADDCHSSTSSSNNNKKNVVIMDKRAYIEAILQVMEDFERQEEERYYQQQESSSSQDESTSCRRCRLPMLCRLIVAVDRSQSLQEAAENIDLAIEFYNNQKTSRVVGVDLGGNPTKQSFQLFAPLFAKARAAGLKVTLHCGEVPCCDTSNNNNNGGAATAAFYNEAVAILDFAPDRLGHAMLLPPNLQERLVQQDRIPIETCPTSNVMTLELTTTAKKDNDQQQQQQSVAVAAGATTTAASHDHGNLIAGLKHHPTLESWLCLQQQQQQQQHQEHYPLCISTDDPGVFCTTLTQELLLIAHAFGIPKERLAQIVVESVKYAFCDDETKLLIQQRMQQRLTTL